jgi:serine/threonine protein kinase
MTPVGLPLSLHASGFTKSQRIDLAVKLKNQLLSTLDAAHRLGYCHCDFRPDNIIFNPADESYIIIDWGLACSSGTEFHGYIGGLPFFHDDIINYVLLEYDAQKPRYTPMYDIVSAHYVVYAFKLGKKHLTVPWATLTGEELIEMRSREVDMSTSV